MAACKENSVGILSYKTAIIVQVKKGTKKIEIANELGIGVQLALYNPKSKTSIRRSLSSG